MTKYRVDLARVDRATLEVEAPGQQAAISEAIRRIEHTDMGIDIDVGRWGVDYARELSDEEKA